MKNIFALFLIFSVQIFSANAKRIMPIQRVDPPNWWVGMAYNQIQLCVKGRDISQYKFTTSYPGVTISKINLVENPNYLFIDLSISPKTQAGSVVFDIDNGNFKTKWSYELKERDKNLGGQMGFDESDLVYLIMPDRFANGDSTNDKFRYLNQTNVNRDSLFQRHGGDLKGIVDHLDYIKNLGMTTIWLTPFQQNNQPLESYHGYAITDHYNIDERLGDYFSYLDFVKNAHEKKLKVVMDMVFNHCGSEHYMMADLPMKNWIHQFDTFFKTSYRAPTLVDPYASEYDKNKMSNGWFAKHMPDLNQQNPYVAKYLIQNALWWIETSHIDGFRIDTYTYSDFDFMSDLMRIILKEYPKFHAVGELWDHGVGIQSYFQQNPKISSHKNSYLPGLIDFQLNYAITEATSKPMDWTGGLAKIYYTLAQDFLCSAPSKNLTFLDNHDFSRYFSMVGEDIRKWKMGIGFLLTTRGIPSIYYGTEILMKNYANPDGKVREDFPGGWASDKQNAFTREGRTASQNEAFDYLQKLALYRKTNPVLQTGKLTQFVPENDVYVYFRENEQKRICVIMHYKDAPQTLDLGRFAEKLKGFSDFKNIQTAEKTKIEKSILLQPYEIKILELEK